MKSTVESNSYSSCPVYNIRNDGTTRDVNRSHSSYEPRITKSGHDFDSSSHGGAIYPQYDSNITWHDDDFLQNDLDYWDHSISHMNGNSNDSRTWRTYRHNDDVQVSTEKHNHSNLKPDRLYWVDKSDGINHSIGQEYKYSQDEAKISPFIFSGYPSNRSLPDQSQVNQYHDRGTSGPWDQDNWPVSYRESKRSKISPQSSEDTRGTPYLNAGDGYQSRDINRFHTTRSNESTMSQSPPYVYPLAANQWPSLYSQTPNLISHQNVAGSQYFSSYLSSASKTTNISGSSSSDDERSNIPAILSPASSFHTASKPHQSSPLPDIHGIDTIFDDTIRDVDIHENQILPPLTRSKASFLTSLLNDTLPSPKASPESFKGISCPFHDSDDSKAAIELMRLHTASSSTNSDDRNSIKCHCLHRSERESFRDHDAAILDSNLDDSFPMMEYCDRCQSRSAIKRVWTIQEVDKIIKSKTHPVGKVS